MTNKQVCSNFINNPTGSWQIWSSNMSYGKGRLFSYNSILAKHIDGTIHIDYGIARYSNSSAKQANHLRRVIPTHFDVFEYDFNEPYTPDWYLAQCYDLIDKQKRARKVDYTRDIKHLLTEAILYSITYNEPSDELTYLSEHTDDFVGAKQTLLLMQTMKEH